MKFVKIQKRKCLNDTVLTVPVSISHQLFENDIEYMNVEYDGDVLKYTPVKNS